MKVLVTGGVRSGKSTHAESLLVGEARVTYVAPGPARDVSADPESADPEWAERVARHQSRRPPHWTTVETSDIAAAVTDADGAVLVDCLGTWLTAVIDHCDGWETTHDDLEPVVFRQLDQIVESVSRHDGNIVFVTNEVGMSVVPEHRSGRVFRDLLGMVNQRMASACDDVFLVVAGRVLKL